jgi:transcriptional regulator with AAA-type ATPase domain/tetratricopeptide (TPR) repeat protein
MSPFRRLVGESPGIVVLREQVAKIAGCSERRRLPTVLIQGETGTGKGLLARLLHESSRHTGPFVAFNCAAVPDTLLEAELFGVERGAFTGADQARSGLFQAADGGTLFLDEIGALSPAGQAKLLTAIEDRVVRPLGGGRPQTVDVWIIAASSQALRGATDAPGFREDLFHRLARIPLVLPPLRNRGADILELADYFLAQASTDLGAPPKTLGADARAAVIAYPWPGNVRELANVMERVTLMADEPVITTSALELPAAAVPAPTSAAPPSPLLDTVGGFERARILSALEQTGWNVAHAAALLRVSRTTLRRRMAQYHLAVDDDLEPPATVSTRPRRAAPIRRGGREPSKTGAVPAPAGRLAASDEAPATISAGPTLRRWECRTVALLGVTVDAAEDWGAAIAVKTLETVVDRVRGFAGHILGIRSHRLVVAFGVAPVADAPVRAVQAALAVERALARLDDEGHPAVRMSVHVAPVLVARGPEALDVALADSDPAWDVLDAALQDAKSGAIVASEAAAPFLARAFSLRAVPRGPGRPPTVRVGRRLPETGEQGRPMTRFVGRAHELALLEARLVTVEAGHGQLVGVIGDPGLGKSRLLGEFRRRLTGEWTRYLEGHCAAAGQGTSYGPIVDLVRMALDIGDATAADETTARARARIAGLRLDTEWAVSCLHRLLGISEGTEPLAALTAEAIRLHTFEALRQLWMRMSVEQPLVLAIEDLHWIDATSEAFLASLAEALPGARILVCVTYRPGYQPPWMGRSHATQLALSRLSQKESLELAHAVLGGTQEARQLADAVVPRAQGNPFFLEELVRAVGEARETSAFTRVPETVEATILGRMQQLPAAEHRLLATAAVLGHAVPVGLLHDVCAVPDELDAHLRELLAREFLRVVPGLAEGTYGFTHALTQDVAYASLDPAERARLHERAGWALERASGAQVEGVLDQLAHHYGRSSNHEKAVAYLTQLADRAAAGYALGETITTLDQALAHAEHLTGSERRRQRATIVRRYGFPLVVIGRIVEARDLFLRHWREVELLGDPSVTGPYCFWLGHILEHLGRGEEAHGWAERALREATQCADTVTQGRAHYELSMNAFWSGRLQESVRHGQEAVALLCPTSDTFFFGHASWFTGFGLIWLGRFTDALAAAAQTASIGDRRGDQRTQCYGDQIAGWAHAYRGDVDAALGVLMRARDRAADPLAAMVSMGFLGFAQLEAGHHATATASLEESAVAARQLGIPLVESWMTAWLADAHLTAGRPERARSLAEEALAQARRIAFPLPAGLAQRVLGRVAAAVGHYDEAAHRLNDVLRLFDGLGARYEVARTHLDLAAVARTQGHCEVASRHLSTTRTIFEELNVPIHVARTTELARELVVA